MHATATARKRAAEPPSQLDVSPEAHETAARLGALLRYVFLFDRGEHLRAIEESGLTMTQVKALLLLRGAEGEPRQVSDIAEALGLSPAATSRAIEGMVKKRLVTRAEDEHDRRVRRVAVSSKGEALAEKLIATRMAGLEAFTTTLTAAQRRKIDSAVESLLDREDIARAYAQLREVAK